MWFKSLRSASPADHVQLKRLLGAPKVAKQMTKLGENTGIAPRHNTETLHIATGRTGVNRSRETHIDREKLFGDAESYGTLLSEKLTLSSA